jgi:hypothetical protein
MVASGRVDDGRVRKLDGRRPRSDPRAFAVYLEQVSALDAFRDYRQRSLALLEPAR